MTNLDVASPRSTKQTILAVDDDTAIIHLCATILEQAGFSVLPATNSSEALEDMQESSTTHSSTADQSCPAPARTFVCIRRQRIPQRPRP